MVTIQELKELNEKINSIKTRSAALQAEVKVLSGQLETRTTSLSQTLGVPVTKDNLEALYQQASAQLEEKASLVRTLLNDLENSNAQPAQSAQPVNTAQLVNTAQTFVNPLQNNVPPVQPQEQPAAPVFSNFGTATTFQI